MPELPEVETVRAGLEPVMAGRVIARVTVNRPDLRFALPERMAERLTGAGVLRLRRRSKYILVDLSTNDTLLIHLGMSGRLLVSADRAPLGAFHHPHPVPGKHDHVLFDMEGGARITFNDARRFGAMDLVATGETERHRLLRGLGPEPLGNAFSEGYLAGRLNGRAMPVKAALLDQRIIAGLGNIYVSEALFRAGIDPRRAAGGLKAAEIARLVPSIREVLSEAIAAGGSSLRDYRQTDGELGYFQHAFRVYDRAGAPCPNAGCRGTIGRTVQSGRSSYFCPKCQR
jgi:formamidopyrimidine-DNA glycosylase